MTYYGTQQGVYIGWVYNPLIVADRALEYLAKGYLKRVKNCIKIILNHVERHKDYAVIVYKYPHPFYGLPKGWRSCMAQGAALLLLYKARRLTDIDEKIREVLRLLLEGFKVKVEDGGLAYNVDGGLWFEEYAHPLGRKKPFVLNGFMYSLIRLYEYYSLSKDEKALSLFKLGLKGLKKLIHKFDTGKWTYYDLLGTDASWPKHKLHVEFSKKLYEYTGDSDLGLYYRKFKNYMFGTEGVKHFAKYYSSRMVRKVALLFSRS